MSNKDSCDNCHGDLNGVYYITEDSNKQFCEDCAPDGAEEIELITG